jgi:hypothetical protein
MGNVAQAVRLLNCNGQCGSSSKTSELYSVGDYLESIRGHQLLWLRFSWFLSVPPGKSRDNKLRQDIFIIHYQVTI